MRMSIERTSTIRRPRFTLRSLCESWRDYALRTAALGTARRRTSLRRGPDRRGLRGRRRRFTLGRRRQPARGTLGDLLLQSVFHAQIATEEGRFNFDDVARAISEKLIRRHPHVFGADRCADWRSVLRASGMISSARRRRAKRRMPPRSTASRADSPALMRAEKVQKKAARVGFDWSELADVVAQGR